MGLLAAEAASRCEEPVETLALIYTCASAAAVKGARGEARRRSYSTSGVWSEAARGVRRGRRYTSWCSLRSPLTFSGACLTETEKQGEEASGAAFMSPVKHYLKGPQVGATKLGATRKGWSRIWNVDVELKEDAVYILKTKRL
ncbi:hypothetical protein NDU88_002827 [Pleurodeles waltl]|uniref:Uncharacterized protein n=1 Tax=Pleurodeles waltl TaxID=8319 RepID=A0AAV7M1S7_PLEWA|nr:hypothetical protein NDU88_002827 [Pleurodeles waltl]